MLALEGTPHADRGRASGARPALHGVPRTITFGSRAERRDRAERGSAAPRRTGVDVPPGIDLDGVLQK